MRTVLLFLVAATMVGCGGEVKQTTFAVQSPDKSLNVQFSLPEDGSFSYSILDNGVQIVDQSSLGVVIDGVKINDKFEIIEQSMISADTVWNMPWGQNKTIKDKHNGLIFNLLHKPSGKKIDIEFRIFDDAVAFRYGFNDAGQFNLTDELSEIVIKDNPTAWYSVANFNTYESEYYMDVLDSVQWIATPVIMRRADGKHIAINEAAIINYPDATLIHQGGGKLKIDLTPWKSGEKARIKAPFTTPWRVIQIADDAKGILASQVLLNLAPESRIADASYCKPMTYVGIWWDFHLGTREWKEGARQGATTYNSLRLIDFAFRNNIGGVVIEGWNKGWDKWGEVGAFDYVTPANNFDLKLIADYAKTCGVRLIMHHETGADIEGYEKLMDSAFMLCKQLGITDLKTGHAGKVSTGENHHGQQMVEHFEKIAQTAAKYGIALDMHEPIKGSGLERTYPNIMTREGVRGLEWEAWSAGNMPSHTTLIPFTRGLSGPTDYTPGIFDILYKKAWGRKAWNTDEATFAQTRVHSTLAHQLSLMLTIYSPFVMAADRMDTYDGHPAFKFVSDLNPDYDQSLVLDAQVGQYIVVARRSGDVWYVGATTNEVGRDIVVPLDFLKDGKWNATLYKDGKDADWEKNPTSYEIENLNVAASDSLKVRLANGGGVAVVIKQITEDKK